MVNVQTNMQLLIFMCLAIISLGSESLPANSSSNHVPRTGSSHSSVSLSQHSSSPRRMGSTYTQTQSFVLHSSAPSQYWSSSDGAPDSTSPYNTWTSSINISPSSLAPPPSSTTQRLFTSIPTQDQSSVPASSPTPSLTSVIFPGKPTTPAAVWTSGIISDPEPNSPGTGGLTGTVSPDAIAGTTSQETTASTSTSPLLVITAYTLDAATVSVSSTVTSNTHTRTGDSSHATAIVPLLFGCWFCPSDEGILLWGMSLPGIYPPPVKPPTPSWPTITIGDNQIPTPDPSSEPDDKTTTTSSTASATSSSTESVSTTDAESQTTRSHSTETSSSTTSTASTDACDANSASKRSYFGRSLDRREITTELDDPLGTALSYLGVEGLQSATLFVSNKQEGPDEKHITNTWAMGVGGTYELPRGGVTIEGVHLTGRIPWMVRWDKDPVKGVHVNGVWGKGWNRVKVAYKFHPDENGGDKIGWKALKANVKILNKATKIKRWAERTVTEQEQLKVAFNDGGTEADAVQAIIGVWSTLITTGSC
ncbi:hypothetical protein BO78DRAFT_47948 [Aspergillus sclerotiicarbonarius CBS 121057]|uniref:Uncharacterized protein n=1 Tax=Aspergillus sclerotiicarbonarius (strain CBS 121057 / IBT 28362) TaxID=1448318 RepID=A0A319EG43_ASPSB|nr:hypothetical protein BO78DRAFT_47948 [Aspergillus sclerotiicarbonarius CBS 121057]